MLIYFFIPIILYDLITINIMTIFIWLSLYKREMFHFQQISSHFSVADVCFFRRCSGGFSPHANDTINPRLLNLTRLPLPLTPPSPHLAFSLNSLGVSLAHAGREGQWQHGSSTLGLYIDILSFSQQQRNVYSLHIKPTLFSMLKNKQNKYFCNKNIIYYR